MNHMTFKNYSEYKLQGTINQQCLADKMNYIFSYQASK